jgi:hypothetical protein
LEYACARTSCGADGFYRELRLLQIVDGKNKTEAENPRKQKKKGEKNDALMMIRQVMMLFKFCPMSDPIRGFGV